MAGDWIKMRSDIYRDPKVSVIAESLMDRGGLLAMYVNQFCQRDMTVTRNVMRNATVGALVSIWGVMRQHGKRSGDDLVCHGVTANVLDDLADMPGFGDAMERAGWVESTDEGIVFSRFFEEHNVEPGDRAKAANAERQRRFRERQKSELSSNVTHNVTVTPRIEKRREEKNNPPIVPPGDQPAPVEQPKPKRAKREAVTLDIYRAAGGKLIRGEDDPVWEYCETIGLPHDFVRLAGHEFLARFGGTKKLQADWPAHFRNAIRANWFRLWFQSGDGWELTTAGHQAKRMQREAS